MTMEPSTARRRSEDRTGFLSPQSRVAPTPRSAVEAVAVGRGWRCRACATRNAPGWQVCRACSQPRPRLRDWLQAGAARPLLIALGAVLAIVLGVGVLVAWTNLVGNGAWVLLALVLWIVLVTGAAIVANRR